MVRLGKKELFVAIAFFFLPIMYFCMAKKQYKKHEIASVNRRQPVMHTVIIGSGCAGLTAATYARRLGLEVLVITGDVPGGLITETGYVENWPGSTKILGSEIADNLKKQAEIQGARFLDDTVARVDFSCWPFKVYTEGDFCVPALSIIIATGSAPRKLSIPGEKEYWGAGVSACAVCDAPFYKEKEVVVVGGGDSAIEEAVLLSQYAKKVTILVRRDRMRAASYMQDRLLEYPTVSILYNVNPEEILGKQGAVTGVAVRDMVSGERRSIAADGLFLAIGHEPNTQIFKDSVEVDEKTGTIKLLNGTRETSLEGIFAAGDVAGRRRQACVAAGSGAEAALDVKEWLDGVGLTRQTAATLCLFDPEGTKNKQLFEPGENAIKQLFSLADFAREVQGKGGMACVHFVDSSDAAQDSVRQAAGQAAKELGGSVSFMVVDTHKATDIAKRFFVQRTPCRLVFNDGSLVARDQRLMTGAELRDFAWQIAHGDHEKVEGAPATLAV